MKLKKKTVEQVNFGVFILLVVIVVLINTTSILPINMVVIDNPDPNSMWPTYFQGDIFLISNFGPEDIEIGDVIVYTSPSSQSNIIHRVFDIIIENGEYAFRVKGDNALTNSAIDQPNGNSMIPYDSILGKVVVRIPEIGHLSLAIQINPVIKTLTLVFAIILALTIIVWPEEKEDEDKDAMVELNKETIVKKINHLGAPILSLYTAGGKKRIGLILASLLIIILIISPLFVTGFMSTTHAQAETGITGVTFDRPVEQHDIGVPNVELFIYIQTRVSLYDASGDFESLDWYTIRVYTDNADENTLISETTWKTLRDIRGAVMVGSVILIHNQDVPVNGTELFVDIEYHIDRLFGDIVDHYTTSFILYHEI
ncbi:MAG: signal peptidase I [Candidatus Heimdallarchaeota archaeon]|nr:signal peptidase I [Candidatus Heimdallarchaeota archaeon]